MEPPIGSRPHMRSLIRGLVVLFVVLGPALGASAHAVLVETDPPDGARLEQMPEQVALRFSEPVSVPEGAVRVFDASGRRVETGEPRPGDSDEEVVVGLDAPAGARTWSPGGWSPSTGIRSAARSSSGSATVTRSSTKRRSKRSWGPAGDVSPAPRSAGSPTARGWWQPERPCSAPSSSAGPG